MLVQVMLERALTSMLADNMKNQGAAFFESLEKSGKLDSEQIAEIRAEWEALVEKRTQESAGSSDALKSFVEDLRTTFGPIKRSEPSP